MPALDNVNAAISEVIQPYIEDVVFQESALLSWSEQNGRVLTQDPSIDLTWPIVTDRLNTGTYRGFFKFPGQEKKVFDKAKVEWKQSYCDFALSAYDALRARGQYAAFQLADALKQNAKMSISELMGRQIYANGLTNSGLDFDGIEIGSDDGTLYPTYATVTRTSVPGYKGYNQGTGQPISFTLLTTAQGNCTIGNSKPDIGITTQSLWNVLQNRAVSQQIFDSGNGNNGVAAMGFSVIKNIDTSYIHDAACPEGTVYGITSDSMEMVVMPDRVWSFTGWEKIPGHDGYEAQFLFMGNFCFKRPRQLFKLYNLTA